MPNLNDFKYRDQRVATYIETGYFTRKKNRNNFIKPNGRLADNIFNSKIHFIYNVDSNSHLRLIKEHVAETRSIYIKSLDEYRIRNIAGHLENKQPDSIQGNEQLQATFLEIKNIFKLDLQATIDNQIKECGKTDIKLEQYLQTVISRKKVQKIERLDFLTATRSLMEKCNSPGSMKFISEFIKFLVKNNDIQKSEYELLRKDFKCLLKFKFTRLVIEAEDYITSREIKEHFEHNIPYYLIKIQGYKELLLEQQHNYRLVRSFINNSTSKSKKIINHANAVFIKLFNEAASRISCYCSGAEDVIDRTKYGMYEFNTISKSLLLAMSILSEPKLAEHQKKAFDQFLLDTTAYLMRILTSKKVFWLEQPLAIQMMRIVIDKNIRLRELNKSYFDIREVFKENGLHEFITKVQPEKEDPEIIKEKERLRQIVSVSSDMITKVSYDLVDKYQNDKMLTPIREEQNVNRNSEEQSDIDMLDGNIKFPRIIKPAVSETSHFRQPEILTTVIPAFSSPLPAPPPPPPFPHDLSAISRTRKKDTAKARERTNVPESDPNENPMNPFNLNDIKVAKDKLKHFPDRGNVSKSKPDDDQAYPPKRETIVSAKAKLKKISSQGKKPSSADNPLAKALLSRRKAIDLSEDEAGSYESDTE